MIDLRQGDCLEILPQIPDNSVDLVLCDLPYGTTQNKWDSVIPFNPMWEQIKRVGRPTTPSVFTAMQPFTSALIQSNPKEFKYCWVWDKRNPTGFLNAKKQPLRRVEDICVFYSKQCVYNPIMETRGRPRSKGMYNKVGGSDNYGEFKDAGSFNNTYYPTTLLPISNAKRRGKVHPTQKPVALMEYLIKTYSNEGDTVLDFVMGSGTTGVACKNLNRKFIGIEKDEKYFQVAKERIND